MSWKVLRHSAKGTTWEEHKYIKRLDGVYYYPDSYEGGRHLPKGEGGGGTEHSEYTDGDTDFDDANYKEANRIAGTDFFGFKRADGRYVILEEDMKWVLPKGATLTKEMIEKLKATGNVSPADFKTAVGNALGVGGGSSKTNLEDWEKKIHKHIESIVDKNPDQFKTTTDISKNLMKESNLDAFKKTLQAITGTDTSKLSDDELKKMRKQISDYYDKDYKEEKSEKKSSSSKKEDKKESDSKKDEKKKEEEKKKKTSSKKTAVDKAVYYGGKNSSLAHHGILGMKWGKRNGPPYPLSESRHSGAEKKVLNSSKRLSATSEDISNKKNVKKTSSKIRTSIARSAGSRETETMKRARKEDINKLTTDELKEYNNRLNAERQFADLTKGNVNSGKKYVTKILSAAASSIITPIIVSAGKKYIESKILNASKKGAFDEFEDFIYKSNR